MFSDTISCLVEASDPELDARIRDLELQRRDVESELAATIAVADTRCLYAVDGHHSMAAYLRAVCNWSHGEVARFTGASRLVNAHPAVGDAWADGHIGSSQIAVLSKTHANNRVAHRFAEFIPLLVDNAEHLPIKDFVATVDHFVIFADSDGTQDDKTAIQGRKAQAVEVAGELNVRASGGSRLETAEFLAIFDRFVEREFQIDLGQRRELEAAAGPDVAFPELRSLTQRRFDALLALARAANAHLEADGTLDAAEPLVSVLADHHTWSWALAHCGLGTTTNLNGESIDPFTGLPADNTLLDDLLGDPADLADRRCVTTNGVPLRPDDVLRAALAGKMRRVILGAKSRPIDLGRAERVFTGAAREAAKLLVAWCEHPGCNLPVQLCQVDHSHEWYEMGRTDQNNSGIQCPGHNRDKHRTRRRVKRSNGGRNYTLRPDGTIILPVGCRPPDFDDADADADDACSVSESGNDRSGNALRNLGALFDCDGRTPEDDRRLVETARNRLATATA
jgi:hypothetical protein